VQCGLGARHVPEAFRLRPCELRAQVAAEELVFGVAKSNSWVDQCWQEEGEENGLMVSAGAEVLRDVQRVDDGDDRRGGRLRTCCMLSVSEACDNGMRKTCGTHSMLIPVEINDEREVDVSVRDDVLPGRDDGGLGVRLALVAAARIVRNLLTVGPGLRRRRAAMRPRDEKVEKKKVKTHEAYAGQGWGPDRPPALRAREKK